MEVTVSEKRAGLLRYLINYDRKKFIGKTPRMGLMLPNVYFSLNDKNFRAKIMMIPSRQNKM
jgi:hypothetical protein